MTSPAPRSEPKPPPMTADRFDTLLNEELPGPDNERRRRRIRLAAGAYAARLIELHARPDDRWGPG